ncbi:hypothetical protein QYF36_019343 [Acer negundo]|nr:hypothetical protein QYF36_019343 [Acer negundo]
MFTHKVVEPVSNGYVKFVGQNCSIGCNSKGIDSNKGWHYISCQQCTKKLIKLESSFRCDQCKKEAEYPTPRYRIEVEVEDKTANATFIIFDIEADKIIGVHVSDVYNGKNKLATLAEATKVTKLTDDMHVYGWPIRVKLTEYGLHNRRAVGHGGYVRRESSNEGMSRETGREGLWNGEDDSNSNSSPEHEWFGKPSVKVGAQVPGCQQNYGFSDKSHSHGDAKVKEALDKGKKVAQKKFKARKVVPRLCNTAVILEKKRVGVFSEGEISFSSSEFSTRLRYPVGECSKKGLNKIESGPASSWVAKRPNGLPSNSLDSYEDPIILDPVCEPDQFLGRVLPEIDNQRDHEPIHLAVDIGLLQCVEGMKVVNGGRSSQTNKRKIARKEGGIRTHDMRTRNKKTAEVLS